jgi:hypothetical protein
MYYKSHKSGVLMKYRGAKLYFVYKGDDYDNGPQDNEFGISPYVSYSSDEPETKLYDIRDPFRESIPNGVRKVSYVYDPSKSFVDNVKALIDAGGFDSVKPVKPSHR